MAQRPGQGGGRCRRIWAGNCKRVDHITRVGSIAESREARALPSGVSVRGTWVSRMRRYRLTLQVNRGCGSHGGLVESYVIMPLSCQGHKVRFRASASPAG